MHSRNNAIFLALYWKSVYFDVKEIFPKPTKRIQGTFSGIKHIYIENTVWFQIQKNLNINIYLLEYSVFQPKIPFILGKSGLVASLKQLLLLDSTEDHNRNFSQTAAILLDWNV